LIATLSKIENNNKIKGITEYLINIIKSQLSWINNEEEREKIWEMTSLKISERSGRSARGDITREFSINKDINIILEEPGLTEDNLGFKTWVSSYILSQKLPSLCLTRIDKILELGSGTGLIGITASILGINIIMTDLKEILPNILNNIEKNQDKIKGTIKVEELDWNYPRIIDEDINFIIAADPIYSDQHPKILVNTIELYLSKNKNLKVIICLPLRDLYEVERKDLWDRLKMIGLKEISSEIEEGYDDWTNELDEAVKVKCIIKIWILA